MNALEDHSVADSPVDMAAVFSRESIVTIPRDAEKRQVLGILVKSIARVGRISRESVDGILEALHEREQHSTTGLGKGLALPHLRNREVKDFAGAIGVAPTGVDFDSTDGLPTRLVILLLSPFDQREKHTEIMARLATLLSDKTLQYSVQLPRLPEALFRFLGF